MNQSARYILIFFSLCFIGIASFAAVNYVVDPFGFYRPHDRGAFVIKPAMTNFEAMSKARIIEKLRPQTIIIGSSRADYGLDPSHPSFDDNAYNGALKGLTMKYLPETIHHAIDNGAGHIVLGLDFFMFNDAMVSGHDMNADGGWLTLVSFSTLKPTLKTLLLQNDPDQPDMTVKGMHTSNDLDKKTRENGTQWLFEHSEKGYLSDIYFPHPHREFNFGESWKNLEDAFDKIHSSDVKLTVFVAPVHIRTLILIKQSGLWPEYIEWRNQLQNIAHKYGYTLKDYTAVTSITTEDISSNMRYYWDNSHYKPALGNMILSADNNLPSNVSNADLEEDITRYGCQNPELIKAIRTAIIRADLENRLITPHSCVSY